MKQLFLLVAILIGCIVITSCKKKQTGVCYCKYLSGDKKEYNLQGLDRAKQQDSCNTLNGYASAFAGDCKLK